MVLMLQSELNKRNNGGDGGGAPTQSQQLHGTMHEDAEVQQHGPQQPCGVQPVAAQVQTPYGVGAQVCDPQLGSSSSQALPKVPLPIPESSDVETKEAMTPRSRSTQKDKLIEQKAMVESEVLKQLGSEVARDSIQAIVVKNLNERYDTFNAAFQKMMKEDVASLKDSMQGKVNTAVHQSSSASFNHGTTGRISGRR